MKSLFCFLSLFCGIAIWANANSADSLRINQLEQALSIETKARERMGNEINSFRLKIERQQAMIDSLKAQMAKNAHAISLTAEQLGVKIDETNASLNTKANSSELKSKTKYGITFLVLLLILGGIVYYLLRRRILKGNADVESLKAKADELNERADKLNEEIVNKFSHEIAEMQKISSSLASISKGPGNQPDSEDHSLIMTLADRITFMEMTLFKMDSTVRGHKQLSKSIAQMKNNLLANGYEIVEMLGKPYNDGMKVIANFVEDDSLEEGKQIITAIVKPQINYKGKMIQAAQITVSQNK